MTDFFDFEQAITDIQGLANRPGKQKMRVRLFSQLQVLNILKKYYRQEHAPRGLTFRRMLGVLDGYRDHSAGRAEKTEETTSYNTIFVAGMHFHDLHNFNLERVRQCVIHYTAQDNGIYPFCTYNSGPCYRDKIERKYRTSPHLEYHEREIISPWQR